MEYNHGNPFFAKETPKNCEGQNRTKETIEHLNKLHEVKEK